ncbi:SOS response-associated peptidase family protein [Comamonas sp. lk]|uniref:SOS response-associated peptidase n=1 Tax=Comamonas sp. lk TaxID=2201272 RepID=UPI000EB0745B|nr:SOS response-associated peptidase family protein [Comamonas sp. lk]
MCNRYKTPTEIEIERHFRIGRESPGWWRDERTEVFPRAPGPFLRRAVDDPGYSIEGVAGQWGLIPWFAKERALKYSTNNARSEELTSKASFKDPWKRGQRCIIPAWTFDEPNWETGKNVWWKFRRADGAPWALAGLWNRWKEPGMGELVESYTMLTINADSHPLMSRMHKPDPKLPPDQQDKRSVISIERHEVDLWLTGTVNQAQQLLKMPPLSAILALR